MANGTDQKEIVSCKVTYFVGKLLAKAGLLVLRTDGLVFIPTMLDKAMGAVDIPIPLNEIEKFAYDDSFQKKLQIKTPSRVHRFIGSGLGEIHEKLIVLKREQLQNANAASSADIPAASTSPKNDVCFNCSTALRPNFKFCPNCSTQIKLLCGNCREAVEETWYTCPFCGKELKKKED